MTGMKLVQKSLKNSAVIAVVAALFLLALSWSHFSTGLFENIIDETEFIFFVWILIICFLRWLSQGMQEGA